MRPVLLLLLPTLALGLAGPGAAVCTQPSLRPSWTTLTQAQKLAYLDAELCLMKAPLPAHLAGGYAVGLGGAQTVWDALQAVHFAQTLYVHWNGAFKAFHRYLMTVHERLLRSECGYAGPLPYWDEQADQAAGPLGLASVFDPVFGFGSNKTDPATGCIVDGPFVNMTNDLREDFTRGTPRCLTRSLSPPDFAAGCAQEKVEACYRLDRFNDFNLCMAAEDPPGPHVAGHKAVGGIMGHPGLSPWEPLFYMHHTNYDRLWWRWQQRDPPARMVVDGILVTDSARWARVQPTQFPLDMFAPYWADTTVTTLDHVLWSGGLAPNVTIRDVIDLRGDFVCAEYV